LRPDWLAGKRRIGVTAGASAPEVLVQEVIASLKALGAKSVSTLPGAVEKVVFPMPRGLAPPSTGAQGGPRSPRSAAPRR
jgi:4-hydroxy-3-methylbut-2-enyl diphosphate reductase